jgi:hypothetical protein
VLAALYRWSKNMNRNLPREILFFINNTIGANKGLYVPFAAIYNACKQDNFDDRTISEAITALTNNGYLEYREKSYRITASGFIYIEAYTISKGIQEEMQEELKRSLAYLRWAIIAAFVAILVVALVK